MKNIIAIFFCLFSLNLVGQSVSQLEKEAQPMIKMYNLDKAQAQQYISILSAKTTSLVKAKDQKVLDKDALEKIELDYEKSFLGILNEDQKKIFETQKIISDNLKNKGVSTDSH